MSLYTEWVNENCDPEDYDEPENRCQWCGAFICKSPRVTENKDSDFILETIDFTCKKCKRGDCEQFLRTPWGSVEVDYLRDGNGDWIHDPAEIERIVKIHNPHRWDKSSPAY